MLAAQVTRFDPELPHKGLRVGAVPEARPPERHPDWVLVDVRAASLNHHDLWALRGVGLAPELLPMTLGTDAAGTGPDGTEVIVHAVIGSLPVKGAPSGAEPRSLLSERYPGTFAERVAVPRENLVPKPPWLSWEEAACLPTAWLTAYRALFRAGRAEPGDVVLVQGAGGGVATAATVIGAAAGLEVHVTSRDFARRQEALRLGAAAVHKPGEKLPVKVDVVVETVGHATWEHSMRSVRPGGAVVVVGATTGDASPAQLRRVFFHEIRVLGVTMGSVQDLADLVDLLGSTGARPVVDTTFPLVEAGAALARLETGEQFGKIVLTV